MITIIPFKALRPEAQHAKNVASQPYDVLSSKEAKIAAQGNPYTFLHVTKSEIDLPDNTDIHSQAVYEKAKENLQAFIGRKLLFRESKPCYYLYRIIMDGRSQTGIVCGSSVEDYQNNLIKKHEFTRPEKELDRINHMKTIMAQTGNVFLTYRNVEPIDNLVSKWTTDKNPQYDFVAEDGVQHSIWIVNDNDTILAITNSFHALVPASYIADGHHRAASAAKVKEALGENAPNGASYFLTTLFPANQLHIMDYNRVVKDLNGLEVNDFIEKVKEKFKVDKVIKAVRPASLHEFGMYINKSWYKLSSLPGTYNDNDPIAILDITVLSENILDPILGIKDQRTDERIDFVGGIRGLEELERRVDSGEMAVAFSLFPVSMDQLLNISDAGKVMPPKSTWFEPKLRDGLLTNIID